MNLLDLPPEIFQNITHSLVSTAGIRAAWKLRRVCRTFAAEIKFDIFTKQSHDKIQNEYKAFRVLENEMWLFFFYRVKMPLLLDKRLTNKINDLMAYLTGTIDIEYFTTRDECLENICKIFVQLHGRYDTFHYLGGIAPDDTYYTTKFGGELSVYDKVVGAAAAGNVDLIQKILPVCTDKESSSYHSLFGDPLYAAAVAGHVNVIDAISEHLHDNLSQPPANRTPLFEYYKDNRYQSGCDRAMRRALSLGKLDVIDALIALHKNNFGKFDKSSYNGWLEMAVVSGNAKSIRHFMKMTIPKGGPRVIHSVFRRACQLRNADAVAELLTDMDPDRSCRDSSPLLAAIESDRTEIVEKVLDAGADIDGVCGVNKTVIPLAAAMNNENMSIVRALIERGADLNIEVKSRDRKVYNFVRDAKMKKIGCKIPTYEKLYTPTGKRRR